ncbi:MAG: helix-turn-helix domain-containing protein [Halieaceae bacterium]|nr:helix-turn-helix domain-containing protein [Halieaceae bacterium]
MGVAAAAICLSLSEQEELEHLVRCSSAAHCIVQRARMILALARGLSITETSQHLGVWRKTVSGWRLRWLSSHSGQTVAERLSDQQRSGAPPRITAEETCAIIALACRPPADFGLPLSHWSAGDLAREAQVRGIVASISPRTAGRILKRCRPQATSFTPLADAEIRP